MTLQLCSYGWLRASHRIVKMLGNPRRMGLSGQYVPEQRSMRFLREIASLTL